MKTNTDQPLDTMSQYIKQISSKRLLTAEEEISLAISIAAGDFAARQLMIESNLRLVVSMVRRFANRGVPMMDLIEEGNLGLITAVEKFDPKMGCRFSTYAAWWINQSIEISIVKTSRAVRLPHHVIRNLTSVLRAKRGIEATEKAHATDEDIAEKLNISVDEVRRALECDIKVDSLDSPEGDEARTPLGSTLSNNDPEPDDLLQEEQVCAMLDVWLSKLTDKQRKIIEKRFGLNNQEISTLEELASEFSVTHERIRQIQIKILENLSKFLQRQRVSKSDVL